MKIKINKGLFRFNLIPSLFTKVVKKGNKSIQITINPIVAMFRRNSGQSLVAIIFRLLPAMGGRISPSLAVSIKTILHRLSAIANDQGIIGLVKYLKMVSILTQQSISGYKIHDMHPRVSRTNSGIPRLFPVPVRNMIRKGNSFYIRFALTVASLYRDLTYNATPNLSTITEPYSGNEKTIKTIVGFIPTFVKLFVKLPPEVRRNLLMGKFVYFPILKSSPQTVSSLSSTNPVVLVRSAGSLTPDQIDWISTLGKLSLPEAELNQFQWLLGLAVDTAGYLTGLNKPTQFSGKLGFKQEAAGKVRVFAMVDPWSQLVLAPFHKILFNFLAKHKRMDGTFNQLGPLQRIPKGKPLYSMDLSAATDRLPIRIQTPLIREVFNLSYDEAMAWESLLIKRAYMVDHRGLKDIKSVQYSVGQPMGALSSWAMLAITHHLIVQFAAIPLTQGRILFKDYALLGDDLVIYNHVVAKRYHKIISGMGVECNLAKSIISPNGVGLEFAKQTFFKGENVSPTPLKELTSALQSLPGMLEYISKYKLTLPMAMTVAGFGYKVKGSLNKPIHKLNIKVRYLALGVWLSKGSVDIISTFHHLRRYFSSEQFCLNFYNFFDGYLSQLIEKSFMSFNQLPTLRPDLIPSETILDSEKMLGLPETFSSELRSLAHEFGLTMMMKSLKHMGDCLSQLRQIQTLTFQSSVGPPDSQQLLELFSQVLNLEQESTKFSVSDIFNRNEDGNQNRRPGFSKLFRLHQAYCAALLGLRQASIMKPELAPIADQVVSMKQPEFFPAAFKGFPSYTGPSLLGFVFINLVGYFLDSPEIATEPNHDTYTWAFSMLMMYLAMMIIEWIIGGNL